MEVQEVALRGRRRRRRKNRQAAASSSSSSVVTEIADGKQHAEDDQNEILESEVLELFLEKNGGAEESTGGLPEPKDASETMDFTTSKPEISPAVSSPPPQYNNSPEEQTVTVPVSKQLIATEYGSTIISLMNESRRHVTEVYLDKVFEKPGTHEFYCPNCQSCVKKVILRGGEPEIRRSAPPQLPEPPVEPFRCTECFSFLIPLGNWFFRRPDVEEVTTEPSTNAVLEQPGDSRSKAPSGEVIDCKEEAPSVGAIHGQDMSPSSDTVHDPKIVHSGNAVHGPSKTVLFGTPADQNGVPLVETPPVGPNKAPRDQNKAPFDGKPDEQSKAPPSETLDYSNVRVPEINKVPLPVYEFGVGGANGDTEAHEDDEYSAAFPEIETPQVEGDISGGITSNETQEDSTGPVEAEPPATMPDIALAMPVTMASIEPRDDKKLEILKSIVYGGLTESIASLCVVTSAASADATTLNILTLALANLIGGLIMIGHNVWDLVDEEPRKVLSKTNEQVDRYHKLLGQRKNFALEATVVVLSFLVFGLVPPVVYGFSFRESNERDYKLAAVAAASLACIAVLAIGKAHIQKPEKYITYIRTTIYYVTTAVIASGISYIAGELIKKLIEKLGWFNSDAAIKMSLADGSSVKPIWASS